MPKPFKMLTIVTVLCHGLCAFADSGAAASNENDWKILIKIENVDQPVDLGSNEAKSCCSSGIEPVGCRFEKVVCGNNTWGTCGCSFVNVKQQSIQSFEQSSPASRRTAR